jgi:hypothetical protein
MLDETSSWERYLSHKRKKIKCKKKRRYRHKLMLFQRSGVYTRVGAVSVSQGFSAPPYTLRLGITVNDYLTSGSVSHVEVSCMRQARASDRSSLLVPECESWIDIWTDAAASVMDREVDGTSLASNSFDRPLIHLPVQPVINKLISRMNC